MEGGGGMESWKVRGTCTQNQDFVILLPQLLYCYLCSALWNAVSGLLLPFFVILSLSSPSASSWSEEWRGDGWMESWEVRGY